MLNFTTLECYYHHTRHTYITKKKLKFWQGDQSSHKVKIDMVCSYVVYTLLTYWRASYLVSSPSLPNHTEKLGHYQWQTLPLDHSGLCFQIAFVTESVAFNWHEFHTSEESYHCCTHVWRREFLSCLVKWKEELLLANFTRKIFLMKTLLVQAVSHSICVGACVRLCCNSAGRYLNLQRPLYFKFYKKKLVWSPGSLWHPWYDE